MKKRILSIVLAICLVLTLAPTMAFAEDSVYVVAGVDTLCGSSWDATDDNNRMTYNEETGRFEKVYTDVAANPITGYEYKIVKIVVDGATWIPDGAGSNPTVYVDDDNATVTIWYDEETGEWGVDIAYGTSAPQQYTVTYDGGDSEGSIPAGTKTHDVDYTLSSETFTMDGFVQTGWVDKEGVVFDLGGTYTADQDVTLYPYWEKLYTLTAPFTTTVKLGGNTAPGETAFELAIVDVNVDEDLYADVTVSGTVTTTNGAGDYSGAMTITGPEEQLWFMLSEGVFVQQVNAGEENWTYDDTVYGLVMPQVAYSTDDSVSPITVLILPTAEDDAGNYYIDWEAIDWENDPMDEMRFTNTYTKTVTETTSPQTGDNSNLTLWLALLAVSAAGVLGTGVYCKRRKSSRAK